MRAPPPLAPAALLLSVLACTPEEPAPEPAERVAFVALSSDVGSLVQHFARSAQDVAVSEPLSLFLVRTRFDDGTLHHGPGLATSWQLSDDGATLELQLRDDNRWHDGEPVTAEDVVFTLERMADEAMGSRLAGVMALLDPEGPEAPDPTTVRLRLRHPGQLDALLGELGGVVILPKHLLGEVPAAELRTHPFNRDPVLNGCWRLDSWEPGTQITLAARPWGDGACAPSLDRVVFRVVPEPTARLLDLGEGRLDVVPDIRVQDLATLAPAHPELGFHRRGPRSLAYVGWNTRAPGGADPHPILGDVRVRRALAQAVDIDSLMRDLFLDQSTGELYAQQAVGSTSPAVAGMDGAQISPLPCDPAAARAALEALGWQDHDQDGVLDRDGRPFHLELLTQASATSRAQAGLHVQADLAEIGVQIAITPLERAAWIERAQQGDFDALLGGWSAALYVDLATTWHSGPDAHYNWTGYANPTVDALIDQGLAAPSAREALPAWQAAQAAIYQDQPYLFLYWADEIVAVNRRLSGVGTGLDAPWRDPERWTLTP